MIVAKKIEIKHNFNELKMCTTKPSLYKSEKPVKTWAGEGKRCFSPDVVANQITIKRTNHPTKISVLFSFDIFSKGVKNFTILIVKGHPER